MLRQPSQAKQFTPIDTAERTDLLMRYASGRIRHFLSRQLLAVCGIGMIFGVSGLPNALIALAILIIGDVFDCMLLRRVPALYQRGMPLKKLQILTTASATVQALSIVAAVALAWLETLYHDAPIFTSALLAGAGINAALAMPHHPGAAIARLIVFGLGMVGFFVVQVTVYPSHELDMLVNGMGILTLCYAVLTLVHFVRVSFHRNRRYTQRLLAQSRMLEETNAELRAREAEARQLSLVARYANDCMLLSDGSGKVIWANDAFFKTTRWSAERLIGRYPSEFLENSSVSIEIKQALEQAIEKGEPLRIDMQMRVQEDQPIWHDLNLVPVAGEDGQIEFIIVVQRDVTAAREHAHALEQARNAAEEGARIKSEFLATMSHEIRTPMHGIIGMADLLEETIQTPAQRDYTDTIRSSAQALLAIINDVLDLSKLEAQKVELHPVCFDLTACLRESVRLIAPQAREKGLSLELKLKPGLPRYVRADDGRLRQILINLIGNAVKFTETGRITVHAEAQREDGQLVLQIAVSDTGIGIAEDKQSLIFERFSQAESTTTRQFGGTGLGLAISSDLARAMGGGITVQSELGKGSCFTLRLQAEPQEMPDNGSDEGPVLPDLQQLEGFHILVADDNQVNRMLIRKLLAALPVTISFAHDGQQAVDMTEAIRPDLVLMDMSMPVLNGLEATRAIRAAGGRQPRIIALTANTFASDRAACKAAGMDGFLSKPIRKSDLIDAVAQQVSPPAA